MPHIKPETETTKEMKHHLSELFFRLYCWSCNMTQDEYWEHLEELFRKKKAKTL